LALILVALDSLLNRARRWPLVGAALLTTWHDSAVWLNSAAWFKLGYIPPMQSRKSGRCGCVSLLLGLVL